MFIRRFFVAGFLFTRLLIADQVTLKNGDKVSGVVIKKDGDKLTLKSDLMGEVTMPWNAVVSITSDAPLQVVLPNGNQVNGTLATKGSDLQVKAPAQTVTTPIGEVAAVRNSAEQQKYERLLKPSWLNLWAGYADLGLALARGNARTNTLNSSFVATRATNNDKTSLFFNQIYSTATILSQSATTADAARGGISYDHNISSRLFLNFQNTDEYDSFQNLDFRFTGGAGLGFHAIKTERTVLDLLLGADYTRESFSNGLTRNSGELNGGDDWSYKISGITSLTQAFRIFDAPSSGRYRVNFDIGAATTIKKWLSWQVTASDRFLSDPLPGRRKNDVLLTTGIRVAFAQ